MNVLPKKHTAPESQESFWMQGNWLYAQTAENFILESQNPECVAVALQRCHLNYLHVLPSESEMISWRETLPKLASLLQRAGLKDQLVFLEYLVPANKKVPHRIDAIICGNDMNDRLNAVVIELKGWSTIKMKKSRKQGHVQVKLNGGWKHVLHPRVQAESYCAHLQAVEKLIAFKDPVQWSSYAYMPNAFNLTDKQYNVLYKKFPNTDGTAKLYTKKYETKLMSILQYKVGGTGGHKIISTFSKLQYECVLAYKLLPVKQIERLPAKQRKWWNVLRYIWYRLT